MNAAVLHGREDLRIQLMEPRALAPGEVRVGIEAALTCGTDLKVFRRGYHARMLVPPSVFGHEFAGTLTEVSTDLGGTWKPGDRVVAANSAPCGQCAFCQHNQENLCDDLIFLNGAYAESIVVPARLVAKNLLKLKSETSYVDAALTEPLACVVQGVEDSQLKPGQRCLVMGAGPIGLMFVALARNLGLDVTVVGRGQPRLQKAGQLGAQRCIDVPGSPDLVMAVKAVDPVAFDVVIEAVGKPETWEASVQLVRKGGLVNFFGGCPSGTQIQLDTGLIHYSSLTLRASFHHTPRTIRRALKFIEAGVIRAADFVDGECALTGLPALFQSMAAGNRAIKTLVRVRE
jgi:L-iditol 2-dehydrogenase